VPLHTHHEALVARHLDALDDAVRRPRHLAQPIAQALDRLVMHTVHLDLARVENPSQPRALAHDLDSVRGLIARRLLTVRQRVRPLARNVLHERAAERHVQHLDAAADREQRHLILHCAQRESKLERVAGRGDVVDRGVSRFTEA
jgi:hypothetical protein